MSNNDHKVSSMKNALRKKGFRLSQEREIIIGTLINLKSYATADELYLEIVKSGSTVSRATIYRTLNMLVEQGLVSQISYGREFKRRFGANIKDHCYAVCQRCGKVEQMHLNVKRFKKIAQEVTGYELSFCQIAFEGICPKCRKAILHGGDNK